ncbi:hypothetical protein T492DRAFT_833242 [Pavlovales sp. CCMP2436]|nr:hypothetical protein T492DRAFT_833242 [Pavlovales sp. CCMP2436]
MLEMDQMASVRVVAPTVMASGAPAVADPYRDYESPTRNAKRGACSSPRDVRPVPVAITDRVATFSTVCLEVSEAFIAELRREAREQMMEPVADARVGRRMKEELVDFGVRGRTHRAAPVEAYDVALSAGRKKECGQRCQQHGGDVRRRRRRAIKVRSEAIRRPKKKRLIEASNQRAQARSRI